MRAIKSLRARLSLLALLPLVPLLAVFVHAAFGLHDASRDAEITANLELGRMAGAAFGDFVGDVSRTTLAVGQGLASGRLSREEASELLESAVAEHGALREVSWASPAGTVSLSTNPQAIGLEVGDREYFRRLLRGETTVVSDLLHARTDEGYLFVIGRGIRGGSGLVGMVLAVVDPERLRTQTFSAERIGDAALTLVDRTGRIAFRSPPGYLGWEQRGIASYEPLVHRALGGEEATGVFTAEQGGDTLGAAVPIGPFGWAALASRRTGEIFAPVHRELAESAVVALIAATLSLVASMLVGGRIARSLRRLEAHAVALGRGERPDVPAVTAPEIARLGRAYAAMAARVRSAHDRLQTLHSAGVLLSESLDVEEVARRLARFAVPSLADWCAIDELARGGGLRRLAAAGLGTEQESWAREGEVHRPDPASSVWQALVDPRSAVHVAEISPDPPDPMAGGSEYLARLQRAGVRSCVFAPLVASGTVVGVATFASRSSFEKADVRLLEELARRAAQAIANARLFRDVELAVRSRDEVLSIVSHDLRTPLGAIMLGARVVADLPEPSDPADRARTTARRMLASAQRMARLIGDLLDLASLREGRLAMARRFCAPGDLLREACEESRGAARERALELECHVAALLPDVACDPGRVLQVLGNLASNAIKSTATGHVRIAAEPGDGEVVFSVSDTGPGIPEDEQARLFEAFRRGAGAAYRGTGLGLAISRALVEAHGGRIWIESRPGQGTTVKFTLPARRDAHAARASRDQAGGAAAEGAEAAAAR